MWLANIFKNTFNVELPPDKVAAIKTVDYDDRQIISREEGILLYAGGNGIKFDIVMHKHFSQSISEGYSLFRSEQKEIAQEKFDILKDKLPILMSINDRASLDTLQKYCNVINEHPSWTVCHIAVNFNLLDVISMPSVLSEVNTPCTLSGISPVQVAVMEGNLLMTEKLISLNANLLHLDHDANSVYHFAANTNKEIVLALAKNDKKRTGLNQYNVSGCTPLHMACMWDKPECVIALISQGSDPNRTSGLPPSKDCQVSMLLDFPTDNRSLLYDEMKFGGTPLHWASSRDVIDILLDRKCNINAFNFASRTALHVMVMRNKIENVIALLARDADVNLPDIDGNSALHLAVKENNIPIVQALIVFGADIDHLNNRGETARHMAAQSNTTAKLLYVLHGVGAARCTSSTESCTPGCATGGTDDGIPPPPASAATPRRVQTIFEQETLGMELEGNSRGGRVLSLDGGGIRGLVLVVNLLHLEAALGRPLIHCFDWIAATSTGGMLALALAAGKTLRECLCIYFKMKQKAFVGYRPYKCEPLEEILQEILGTDSTMANIEHPKVMITACLADRKPVDLHLFRNYESANEMLANVIQTRANTGPEFQGFTPHHEQKIWEAARATGAAPSYFRAYKRFVDGGLISNNPTLDAITEIHEYNTALSLVGRNDEVVPPKVIVSIGTGSIPLAAVDCMDVFWPSGIMETAKAVSGMLSMQTVLVDQATLADGRLIDRTRALCSMLKIPYFRFSPTMSEEIQMDEKSDAKLVQLLWETKVEMIKQSEYVNRLATILNS